MVDVVKKVLNKMLKEDNDSKNRGEYKKKDEYGMRYARSEAEGFTCKKCGANFSSRGELFEHKKRCR